MLTPGTRVGPYEVLGSLGAGGMGEVYRARDTRLDRTVALKVLPAAFAADPLQRQRLEREARAISALDHPHICSLFDIGSDGGIDYLVMPLIQGETLAARLTRGPLPLGDLSTIGAEVAEALAAAHARGIVHRDLKPGNVMLTRDGVRLLDFGLAKQPLTSVPAEATASVGLPLTAERSIVGTLPYMAPEQLEGREVDHRADIFALGAVLYEMLTGQRAYGGDSSASVIASIMKGTRPPLASLAPAAPAQVVRIVDRCLAVDPRDRWQSAADLSYALRDMEAAANSAPAGASVERRPAWQRMLLPAAALVLLAVSGWLALSRPPAGSAPAEIRLSLVAPDGQELPFDVADYDPDFAISPDGRRIAFVTVDPAGEQRLLVRDLSSESVRQVSAAPSIRRPFWSPDGSSIGYVSPAGLVRVNLDTGTVQPIATSVEPAVSSVATWTFDGRIIYEARGTDPGSEKRELFIVPDSGGKSEPVPLGGPTEQAHRYPVALPNGNFLYLSWSPDPATRAIYIASPTGERRSQLVSTGFRAEFVEPDTLLYVRDGVLVAQRFSIEEARMLGEPKQVVFGVAMEGIPGQTTFSASRSGAIAYRRRSHDFVSELRWIDRSGNGSVVAGDRSDITVNLSPDDRRVAISHVDAITPDNDRLASNIWLFDLGRRVPSRFTLDRSATDENPVWSPDGSQIAYATHTNIGLADVRLQITAGSSNSRIVASGPQNFHPIDWSRDGTLLLHSYRTGGGADDIDLYLLDVKEGAEPRPFIVGRGSQAQGQFSPDGQWIAYTSDETGRAEVYVLPRDGRNRRVQISAEGGAQPRWRDDGREIFYVSLGGTLTAVPVTVTAADVIPGIPVPLFTEPTLRRNNSVFYYGGSAAYDVSKDGSRFLVNRLTREPTAGPVNLVLNWRRP